MINRCLMRYLCVISLVPSPAIGAPTLAPAHHSIARRPWVVAAGVQGIAVEEAAADRL